jgi:DNA-binding NarL/FixJ family response regulator
MNNYPSVNIYINDENLAFQAGLRAAINNHYNHKGIVVNFLRNNCNHTTIDLVIQSIGSGISSLSLYARQYEVQHKQWVAICEKSERRIISAAKYTNLLGIIYRDDKVNDIIKTVEQALHHRKKKEDMIKYYWRDIRRLTQQERRILCYMKEGLSYEQIANELCINTKTVSTHKCTVMRKLDMKRNVELHHWLSAGGLKGEE